MIEGSSTHEDFAGHRGVIGTGDLQVSIRPYQIYLMCRDVEAPFFLSNVTPCSCQPNRYRGLMSK